MPSFTHWMDYISYLLGAPYRRFRAFNKPKNLETIPVLISCNRFQREVQRIFEGDAMKKTPLVYGCLVFILL